MNNVALINMPFSSPDRPSLGLGLLKSHLARAGVRAQVENFNVKFAHLVGRKTYTRLAEDASPHLSAGDWVFAQAVSDRPLRPPEEYYRLVARNGSSSVIPWLRRARAAVEPFLDECLRTVDWATFDLIGFTSTFCQNTPALALARRLKERFPQCRIIIGGANCEDDMGLALHESFPFVDYVCTGEADLSFPGLVDALRRGTDVSLIEGVVARGDGRSKFVSLAPNRIADLDTLPYPDYDDFFSTPSRRGERRILVMETGRGCWWGDKHHCTFCGDNFPIKFRAKTPERALDEVVALRDRYKTRSFVMTDDIIDFRYFRNFIPALAELSPSVVLFYETKANLSREHIGLLRAAGILQVQPGIESFATNTLRLMRKGTSGVQNVQFLKWCSEYGITPFWNILCGFPGEDANDYLSSADTVGALHHLQPPMSCGFIRLDRFSPYFAAPAEFGISNVRPSEAYNYVYDLPESNITRLAYYFDCDFGTSHHAPELALLRRAVKQWRSVHRPYGLVFSDDGQTLEVVDRRDSSEEQRVSYSGWQRRVYLMCEEYRSIAQVEALAEELRVGRPSLHAFLADLVARKLVLTLDGRCLSLAIRAPDALLGDRNQAVPESRAAIASAAPR